MKQLVKFSVLPGIAILILVLHWLSPGSGPPLVSDLRNTLHAPGFALLTAVALVTFRRPVGTMEMFKVAVLVGGFALLAEASQVFTMRDADPVDAAADLVGIGAVLGLWLLIGARARSSKAFFRRPFLALATACAVLFCIGAPASVAYAIYTQNRLLPVLLDFEHGNLSRLYRSTRDNVTVVSAPAGWPKTHGHVAKVAMDNPDTDGGLQFAAYPDWSAFQSLTFVAASPSPVRLSLRVHDALHDGEYDDRFTTGFQLEATPRLYRVPITDIRETPSGRKLDLERIRTVMFFVADPDPRTAVFIDDIRLEPVPRN